MIGRLSVVVGGNYGSEAKGHVTAWLTHTAHNDGPVACVRPGAHQAGHTAVGIDGKAWALRQVPVAAVVNMDAMLFIAAGSEVSPETLLREVAELDAAGFNVSGRLYVDSAATWLTQEHIDQENEDGMSTGSTKKGVGAARAARIWRKAQTIGECPQIPRNWLHSSTGADLTHRLRTGHHVVVEGVQGYGLGVHTHYYPQTTSGDCRAIDFLAQCGISPWAQGVPTPEIWVVIRPYPIRIAGNSGPLKGETSWEELGLPEEITTVTKLRRRVGEWDPDLVRSAVQANGGNVNLAFSMMDQVVPGIAGMYGEFPAMEPPLISQVQLWTNRAVEAAGDNSRVNWIGTGPSTSIWGARNSGEDTLKSASNPLQDWWVDQAKSEAPMIASKAERYGSNSLAAMGRMIADLQHDPSSYSHSDLLELGCFVYAYGKMERVFDAVKRGEFPDIDSWTDLSVYSKMAQKIRSTGVWP